MDGADDDLVLPLRVALDGLPAICAMSGERAAGAIPVRVGRSWKRWSSPLVRVPLSEQVFRRWSRLQGLHIKARAIASGLTAIAVAIAFRNASLAMVVLVVAVAVHLVDLWAERGAKAARPALTREGNAVRLTGVHPAFARAVDELT